MSQVEDENNDGDGGGGLIVGVVGVLGVVGGTPHLSDQYALWKIIWYNKGKNHKCDFNIIVGQFLKLKNEENAVFLLGWCGVQRIDSTIKHTTFAIPNYIS